MIQSKTPSPEFTQPKMMNVNMSMFFVMRTRAMESNDSQWSTRCSTLYAFSNLWLPLYKFEHEIIYKFSINWKMNLKFPTNWNAWIGCGLKKRNCFMLIEKRKRKENPHKTLNVIRKKPTNKNPKQSRTLAKTQNIKRRHTTVIRRNEYKVMNRITIAFTHRIR